MASLVFFANFRHDEILAKYPDAKIITSYDKKIDGSCPSYLIIIDPCPTLIIDKFKRLGVKIIHINPDPNYGSKIRRGEVWIQEGYIHGLEILPRFLERERPARELSCNILLDLT